LVKEDVVLSKNMYLNCLENTINVNFFIIVPSEETNKQFYNKIYTGQKVSFGKMHKEYQG